MTGKRKGTALTPQQRPRQRVSQQMRSVIDLMVHEGLPLPIAAQRVGMNVESAKRAERKQPARNLYNQMVANVRKGAAQQAYLGIVHQSHSADSERLQYDAKRWVSTHTIDPTPPPSCIWIRLPGPQKRSARRYIQTSSLSRTYFMFLLFFFVIVIRLV